MNIRLALYTAGALLLCSSKHSIAHDEGFVNFSALDTALVRLLTVTEHQLLDPRKAWPTMQPMQEEERRNLATAIGQSDSLGIITPSLNCWNLGEYPLPEGFTFAIVLSDMGTDDVDRTIFGLVLNNGTIVDQTALAMLVTSCSETLLQLPSVNELGGITVSGLRHNFDCESDGFLKTERMQTADVELRLDGRFVISFVE